MCAVRTGAKEQEFVFGAKLKTYQDTINLDSQDDSQGCPSAQAIVVRYTVFVLRVTIKQVYLLRLFSSLIVSTSHRFRSFLLWLHVVNRFASFVI